MPELLTDYGLSSLFLLSFCAATLLPPGSEWLLVTLLLEGLSPASLVAVATIGKGLRYFSLAVLTLQGANAFS